MNEQMENKPKKSNAKQFQFNVKIGDEELQKELITMVDRNGEFVDREDWVRYAVQLMKLQDQKVAAQKYEQEIREFEKHTKRLAEIFVHFVSNVMFQEEESTATLSHQSQQLEQFQAKIQDLTEQLHRSEQEKGEQKAQFQKDLLEEQKIYNEKKKHLEDRIEELQVENAKNNIFSEQQARNISEYQKRIDEKDKEVSRYKQLQAENEQLKDDIYQQREQFTTYVTQLKQTISEQKDEIQSISAEIGKIELDNERRILHLQQEHQSILFKANEDYNTRVRELLEENHAIREQYEQKLNQRDPEEKP